MNHLKDKRPAQRPAAQHVESEARHYQNAADKLNRPHGLAEHDGARDHADDRHEQGERRDRRRRIAGEQPRPQPVAEHSAGIGDDQHADGEPQARMGEPRERRRSVDRERKGKERQRRGEARPDGEGEHVDLAGGLGQHIGRAPEEGGENHQRERPEACAGEPRRADDGDPGEGDDASDKLNPLRKLAQQEPRQRDGEERLRLDDERGQADGKACVDRDEQQAELSDAEQQAIEGDLPGRRLRRPDRTGPPGKRRTETCSADSISGEVSATPTLMAMKVRPQTTATLIAARMSRGIHAAAGDRAPGIRAARTGRGMAGTIGPADGPRQSKTATDGGGACSL